MKSLRLALLTTLALATTGFVTTAMAGGPPPWAPAHGWRAKHHYVYYPDAEVYYAPASNRWFWLDGNGWQAGINLPRALRHFVRTGGIDIDLDVDRPYLRNRYVVRHYGGHRHAYWRHGDDHDRDWDDDDHDWHHRDRDDDNDHHWHHRNRGEHHDWDRHEHDRDRDWDDDDD